MSELPPVTRDQRKTDADQLQLLSIFHFICAGLALFAILLLCAHFAVFHAFFENPKFWHDQKQTPPPVEFFALFKWFYLIFGTWFLISGILTLISGFCLRRRKHRTFSLVVAGINCLHLPVGTVLGVFTIVVLMRETVRDLYEV
jgi:hypothetical protein